MARKKAREVANEEGSADWRRLPPIPRAQELIDTAFKRASRAEPPKGPPGVRAKTRELARVGTVAKTVESRLNRIVRTFPSLDQLHPFYRELVDVLVGLDPLRKSLGAVDWARERVHAVAKAAEAQIRAARTPDEALRARRAAYGRIASFVEQVDKHLAFIGGTRDALRNIPFLDLDQPVLVIAGYPNVGKSSFLAKVSRATPEIAPYPFTTKGIILGHVEARRHTIQVMDTPGLLDRPLEERNKIERQAIQALRHAADGVLFLIDPTGHCGYPKADQLRLLEGVRADFATAPLVVVETKADLGGTSPGHLAMSCETGAGVDETLRAALEATWRGFEARQAREEAAKPIPPATLP